MKRSLLAAFLAFVFTASTVIGVFGTETSALSGSQFKPGRIIDDSLFYNGETMNASQIQNFLNAKVPTCDTNGTKIYSGSQTRAQYGTSRGYPPPYTCLKSYTQNTGYKAGQSGLCSEITAKSNRTAAQIIDDVARACHISQKAIIVMLQKEQGLITDDWPWSIQYRSAMGYGCPDTAACDSQYYGFFNQVYNAALQFQRYKADPNNWNHVPYMTNQVLYQANAPSCGTRSVFIENYATAGLYNYTPYTPNAAALNNLYGTGDACSAYGNRNFWRYYSDWFGSPIGAAVYSYSPVSREVYSDSSFATKLGNGTATIRPNTAAYLKVVVTNTGNQIWDKSFLRLGTANPTGHASILHDASWISTNRATSMEEATVDPGEQATFKFRINTPAALGNYTEAFVPMAESRAWMSGSLGYDITVATPDAYFNASMVEFAVFADAARTKRLNSANVNVYQNEKVYVRVKIKNSGNQPFPQDLTRLATIDPRNRASVFAESGWYSTSRPAKLDSVTNPGETLVAEFAMTAPAVNGTYSESFGLVIEGQRWLDSEQGTAVLKVSERPANNLGGGQTLYPGKMLLSADGRFRLILQGDGNLVLYSPSRATWSSQTANKGGKRVVMQGDGNLVMYNSSGKPVWHTGTSGKGSSRLIMQSDGNAVLYNASGFTWHTHTNGKL